MYIIDFVNYINRRYLSVPSGIATATAIIVTCESFYFTAAKLKYLPPFFLALLLASKRRDSYASVLNHIRTKVRFTLLKSIVMGIRGVRKKSTKYRTTPTSLLSFELIPEMKSYECI